MPCILAHFSFLDEVVTLQVHETSHVARDLSTLVSIEMKTNCRHRLLLFSTT